MPSDEQPFSDLEATLKKSAAALREAQVPFLLGGSLASWARGGPETRHDLDLMIKECDVDRALEALEQVGMRPEKPPEDWLVKAWDGDVLVDLIHHPKGMAIDDEVIARGEEMSVLSMDVRVMSLEDVLVTKLNALTEHHLRYETLLAISRALREQIDWDHVRVRTSASPFARAFFVMVEGLGIVPSAQENGSVSTGGVDVRVVTPGHETGTGRFRHPEDGPAAGSAGADAG
jgi:predicted nucleotidyltransferase